MVSEVQFSYLCERGFELIFHYLFCFVLLCIERFQVLHSFFLLYACAVFSFIPFLLAIFVYLTRIAKKYPRIVYDADGYVVSDAE